MLTLSSGGLDSSLMMLMLRDQGHQVQALNVNYGQLAAEKEWVACKAVCASLGVSEPNRIDVSGLGVIPSGLTDKNLHIEKDAFFPTRNLLFLVIGAAFAYTKSAQAVAIALLANPIFPDQTPEFIKTASTCITAALGTKMTILAPFITLDKRSTLKLARKHGLPIELTYYCHSGTSRPCGVCISCKERIAAEESLLKESREGI